MCLSPLGDLDHDGMNLCFSELFCRGLGFVRGMDGAGAKNSGPLSLESITGVDEAQFILC